MSINTIGSNNPIQIAFGGTGVAQFPFPYAPICGGTGSTDPLQEANQNLAGSGNVLTTLGVGALPIWSSAQAGRGGTFVPGITFGGGSSGISYSFRQGQYFTIGSLVFFSITIILSSKGTSSGQILISGLPVPPNLNPPFSDVWGAAGQFNFATGYSTFIYAVLPVESSVQVVQGGTMGSSRTLQMTNSNFSNNSSFYVQGFYNT